MNPDTGDEAEDWFAKFEREARESAARRTPEEDAAAPTASSPPPAVTPPPQLTNPFDAPAQPPAEEPPPTQAMSTHPDEPTQAMSTHPSEPTQAMPTFTDEPTQALAPVPVHPLGNPEPGSALDALFSDDAFREYEASLGPDPSNSPFANRVRSTELVHVPGGPPPPRTFGVTQKVLAGVGGGLLAVIVLIGLFLLGTRLPDLLGPAPAVIASPTPTPTPTRTPLAIGPVEPGTHDWNELLGGECLQPYDAEAGAWAEEYTVVDCATPHAAQMVFRAWFPAEPVDPEAPDAEPVWAEYPGAEALQTQISLLCSAPGVVDLAAASAYTDAQVQGSYPMTQEQWESDPSYYCFVSRSSGEPLTTSVAIPRASP